MVQYWLVCKFSLLDGTAAVASVAARQVEVMPLEVALQGSGNKRQDSMQVAHVNSVTKKSVALGLGSYGSGKHIGV